MKLTRKILILFLIFVAFIGIVSCSTKEQSDTSKKNDNDKISLNIKHADLIADITDNEKYLNKDYLYELEELNDSDKVNIIVTMESSGLVDKYNKNNKGYSTVSEYVNGEYAIKLQSTMLSEQKEMINKLIEEKYIQKVNHSYTTLFNGFSAQTTYGEYKRLLKSDYDIKVSMSEVYSEPEYQVTSNGAVNSKDSYDAVTNFVKVYETGIFDSSNVKYDGNNTSVAILDSGFDIHHTVFQNMPATTMISMDDVKTLLEESKAYGYHQNIKAQDVYVNDKIPFAYDYADKDTDVSPYDSNHGTHVAGIIGGKDDVITGVAINTQLVLMKVFGDFNQGAVQDDILAALEDSVLLGVDAINLSLGTACGFSNSKDNEYINVVYNKIEEAGISLVVAASNDYSSGYGGEYSNTNKASNPDSATVGSPSTFTSTISVASISGIKSKYIIDETGYTFFFNNANSSGGKPYDFYEMLYKKLGSEKEVFELEYVTVPGVGKKVNYSTIDVKGKIALVKRGDTSFEEKAQVAQSQGAVGCIIYNNIAGEVYMNAGSHLDIALCSISKDDGEYLASKNSGKLIFDKKYLAGPFMSDFSSWGPVSDLSLKPEITAHGGSITSSVPGGGYDEISGTSMASPNLCGVVILVKQALKEKYPAMSAPELTNMANSLLMSTSTIILNEEGNPYSPRKQGSGLGNLEYAVETLAYLSVDGQTKPKLELKDDKEEKGIYELKFNVHNTSNQELKYRLTDLTMTESLSTSDPEYVAEKAYMLNPNTESSLSGDGNLSGDIVTIDANGTVSITYTIKLTEEEKNYIRKSFINGIYIEGFGVLESLNEDKIDLSIPFLAFFGDWTVAPMFDRTFYEVESEAYNGGIDEEDKLKADYYATTPLGRYYHSYIIPLGSYVYEMDETAYDKIPASEEHAAIGYYLDTINGITTVYAGLLRNARKMTYMITNEHTGEVVYEYIKYDEHKAYFGGSVIPGYEILNLTAAELGLQNNTKYTFSMKAELDYGDGGASSNLNNSFEFSFYVDYQAPIITDAEFYSKYDKSLKEHRYYVDVYVYDNHYTQSLRPFTIIDGKMVSLSEYPFPVYSEKGGISKVTVEITDYMDLLQYGTMEDNSFYLPNGLGFMVDDYALNQSYSFVSLPGTGSSNIKYQEEYYSKVAGNTYQFYKNINVGDEYNLNEMLTSDDPNMSTEKEVQNKYFASLKWSSSDENVIKVKNGQIEAVGEGTAIISCSNLANDGYQYTINMRIKVRAKDDGEIGANKVTDIKFTYFETQKAFMDGPEESEIGEVGEKFSFTEKKFISFYPGEIVKINYELEPWNLKDYELIWSTTNEKVAKVDENGVVEAFKEGVATISLKVKINDKVSSLIASTRVVVKNEFIVEGNTLVAYKGRGGDVVIPDDEGILYIGSFAFSLFTTDYELEIKDDNYDAAKTPASNDTITSVTIPADVKEVQKYAFYNCTALETVTFLKDKEGESCPFIKEYAFAGDKKLKNINLNDIELIGTRAFYECEALEEINLSEIYAIGEEAFKNCTNLKYADITTLINGGREAFANCPNLKTITSGEYTNFAVAMFKNSGLTKIDFYADRIPDYCFENCDSLEEVTIYSDIVYVGSYAFKDCSNLKNIEFNDEAGAEFIYNNAFENCELLESITLPDSEIILEEKIFNNCSNLKQVIFNKNTVITNSEGLIFNNCSSLSSFVVNASNNNYVVKDNLLLSKDETKIIFASPSYNYGEYTIPAGIKEIGEGAFSSITSLTSLNLNEVEIVNKNAFSNCINLTNVNLTNENISILDKAFSGCEKLSTVVNIDKLSIFAPYVFANTALNNIIIKENAVISEGAFINNLTLTSIKIKTNSKIGNLAFSGCTSLGDITIDCKEIGDYVFSGCKNLEIINADNLEIIGDGAFLGCIKLTNILVDNVISIGDFAFADCRNLTSISLNKVEKIGSYAFTFVNEDKSNSLTTLTLPDTLVYIGEYAFYYSTSLNEVNIGSGIREIGSYAFGECTSLVTFNTNGIVETINEGTFAEDTQLTSVTIKGIKYVGEAAFINCQSLTLIDLTNTIEIGMQGFSNCSSLVSIDLPNVVKLEAGAFLSASKLETVNMPKVEQIDEQALSCIAIKEIKLPNTIKHIATTAFYYNQYQTKFTDMNGNDTTDVNDYVKLDKGVLYTVTKNNKYSLNTYPTAKADEKYEVIFGTVRIEDYAGYFNRRLVTLVLPDTLKLIGNMAFYGCVNIRTVEFKSTTAPILEGTMSSLNIEYGTNSEIYQYLNKFFLFNGYEPLYYGQFKDMVGLAEKMNIKIPSNANVESYKETVYALYFNIDKMEESDYTGLNDRSIDYLNKIEKLPTDIKIHHGAIITETKTAYVLLNQDLTEYGYTTEQLDEYVKKLNDAEAKWNELNNVRINKAYGHIIDDINELGSVYEFDKISLYYSIVKALDVINRDDLKYIDRTNVDEFKKGFDEYFNLIDDDIDVVKDITTLPTNKVVKVGLAIALGTTLSLSTLLIAIRRFRLF